MKKVPKITTFGYIEKYTAVEMRRGASLAKASITLEVSGSNLAGQKNKKSLSGLMDFLSNFVFSSYLDDDTDYISGSHHPMQQMG